MTVSQIYSETRDNLQIAGKDQPHDVCILRGGFTEFQAKFRVSKSFLMFETPSLTALIE